MENAVANMEAPAQTDFIYQNQVGGSVANALLKHNFDPGALRPYVGNDGRARITVNRSGKPTAMVTNADATLLRLEWTLLDEAVIRAALPRLRAVADMRKRGLQFTIPNGMAKTVLQTQAQSDIGGASISMDGLADSKGDRPVYSLDSLPMPIIHKDFSFSARQIAETRAGAMPLDLSMAELAARRVGEGVEQLMLGVANTYRFGGGVIYGLTNFPTRQTKAMSDPTASGWTPSATLLDILAMRQMSQSKLHFGPWVLYCGLAWDAYLDDDLSIYKGDLTLRDRIRRIDGIQDVVTVDYLTGYDMVLMQTTTDTGRMVVGMDVTTIQWQSHGGMQLNFKVMAIIIPQFRADYNGNCGIVHGSVANPSVAPATLSTVAWDQNGTM